MIIYASTSITLALVFYTLGVWGEKTSGGLKPWHLAIFWIGLAFDTLGTTLMSKIAQSTSLFSFHGITGLAAIILMIFHALWASIVLLKRSEKAKLNFHKFSLMVWLLWLIPFISGAVFGMTR